MSRVHKGYFSIDKKTGRSVDSKANKEGFDEKDVSAYDLILKNKERLLSFDEPTRFIFSHSALREGWDNPNVFQICTLKHSDSNTAKRQEVGRGLRLCVNQDGNRMDVQSCGDSVHEINTLTVVASESYKTFVTDLQSDIKTVLYDRPTVATSEYFKGKYVKVDDVPTLIDDENANAIEFYLIQNGYVDMKRKVRQCMTTAFSRICSLMVTKPRLRITRLTRTLPRKSFRRCGVRSTISTPIPSILTALS